MESMPAPDCCRAEFVTGVLPLPVVASRGLPGSEITGLENETRRVAELLILESRD